MVHAHRLAQLRAAGAACASARSGRSSINSTQSVYYMIKVLLAVFVGPAARAPRRSSRRRRTRRRGARDLMDDPHPDRRDRRDRRAVLPASSSSCAAGGCMERYALLWLFADRRAARAASGAACSRDVASAVGIVYAPSALFAVAFGFVLAAAAALLARDLAPRRPEQGARPEARACCSSGSPSSRPGRVGAEARARAGAGHAGPDDHALTCMRLPRSRSSWCATTAPARSAAHARRRCAAQLRPGDEVDRRRQRLARRHGRRRARRARRRRPSSRARRTSASPVAVTSARARSTRAAAVCCSTPTPCPRPGASTRCAPRRRAPELGRVAGARDAGGRRAREHGRQRRALPRLRLGRRISTRPWPTSTRGPREVGFAPAPRSSCAARPGTRSAASTSATSCTARTSTSSLRLRLAGWGVGIEPRRAGRARLRVHQGRLQVVLPRAQPLVDARSAPIRRALLALLAPGAAGVRGRAPAGGVARRLAAARSCARRRPCCAGCRRSLRRRRVVQATRRIGAAAFAAPLSASLDSPYLEGAARVPGMPGAAAMVLARRPGGARVARAPRTRPALPRSRAPRAAARRTRAS